MVERKGLLTPRQVARAIGVSEASVKRWCDQGLIQNSRTSGGHRRLVTESVVAFLKKTGHAVIEPDVLELPSTTGRTDRILRRALGELRDAFAKGHDDVALQTVFNLREAGHDLAAIADAVLVPAMSRQSSSHHESTITDYQLTRAEEICLRIVHALRMQIGEMSDSAPVALTGALDGNPNTLSVTIAELVLRSAGWNATSLGNLLPFATLGKAIRQHSPRLVYVHVAVVRNEKRMQKEFSALHQEASRRNTVLMVSGTGVEPKAFRETLAIDAYCPDYRSLERQAKKLRRKRSG